MVVVGEVQSTSRSRASTTSRTSKSSKPKKKSNLRRSRSWYCCGCQQTSLPGEGETGDLSGVVWPAPAKFYCCRADLVADMARERSSVKHRENNNQAAKPMEADDDGGDWDEVAEEALPDDTFQEVFDRSHLGDGDERWEITHPDTPYVENLPRQLEAGRAIVISGAVQGDAERFSVNLVCGVGDEPDIAFHFNPRLDRGYVARNSRVRGHWGKEEGAALGGNPFKSGETFHLHILVTATSFKVSVNYLHFCSFQFRMPLSKVCRLEIHGNATISSIKHTRLDVYPERSGSVLPKYMFVTIPTNHTVPWEMNLPHVENLFIGKLSPNLRSGQEITIRGKIKLLPHSIYVNLQQGSQLWPHPNVHFHLNPRFAAENSEHVVVVNTWLQGSWGTEQRYSRCRFRPGHPFSMTIYVEEDRYRVMVDGLQQTVMNHRAPLSFVDTLVVRGDLTINYIGFAQSAPAPERLPSPSSASPSFASSYVHIPMDATLTDSLRALSPGSQSSLSETEMDDDYVMLTSEKKSLLRDESRIARSTKSSVSTRPTCSKVTFNVPSESSLTSSPGTSSMIVNTPLKDETPKNDEKKSDNLDEDLEEDESTQ